jgi:hypothetical protein
VRIRATGFSNRGDSFERFDQLSFHVFRSLEDQDADGLPDTWEAFYGTDDLAGGASADPDADGLSDSEEFQLGTHPLDPDTDDDGELDGSEARGRRCPLDPSDGLMFPMDVEVITDSSDEGEIPVRDDALLLRFPWRRAYGEMRIFRAVDTPHHFALHKTLGEAEGQRGTYYDESVIPGKTYFYRFQAAQAAGTAPAETRFSKVVSGRIPADVPFQRGDADANGEVNIGDAIATLEYLFGGADEPDCMKAADTDDNGEVNIGDAIYALSYLFGDGPDPEPPFGRCGTDATADGLSCTAFAPCE